MSDAAQYPAGLPAGYLPMPPGMGLQAAERQSPGCGSAEIHPGRDVGEWVRDAAALSALAMSIIALLVALLRPRGQ